MLSRYLSTLCNQKGTCWTVHFFYSPVEKDFWLSRIELLRPHHPAWIAGSANLAGGTCAQLFFALGKDVARRLWNETEPALIEKILTSSQLVCTKQAMAGAPRVEIKTSIGTVVVELYTAHAPRTCKNFVELARRGYYNNTVARLLGAQCLARLPARFWVVVHYEAVMQHRLNLAWCTV